MKQTKSKLTLAKLNKSNVWSIDEQDLFNMLFAAQHKEEFADNQAHYMNIIHSVFDIQNLNRKDTKKVNMLEQQHYVIFNMPGKEEINAIAIRKRPVKRITDLTLENVGHQDSSDVLNLIANNLGTGWDGLPLQIRDIIQSAFYVDAVKLPADFMHRKGGIIDRRKADGYEVLELVRGTWIEALFVKPKPKIEKPKFESANYHGEDSEVEDDDEDEDDLNDQDEELVENDSEEDTDNEEESLDELVGDGDIDDIVSDTEKMEEEE